MNDSNVIELLTELEGVVKDEDYEAARSLLAELTSEYANLHTKERTTVKRYSVARFDESVATDDKEKLTKYIQAAIQTELRRSGVLNKAQGFAAGADIEKSEALDAIISLRDTERSLESDRQTASGVDLPQLPTSLLLSNLVVRESPLGKTQTTKLEATVVNIGDETAKNVIITFEVPAGISIGSATITIEQLSDKETVSNTLTGEKDGEYEIEVTAEADADNSFNGAVVEVLNKLSAIERAFPVFESLEQRLTNIDLSKPDKQSLRAKIENAKMALQRAENFTEQGRENKANDQLSTAIDIIGAFLNEIDAIRTRPSSTLSGRNAAFLRSRAQELIDRLSLARDASI